MRGRRSSTSRRGPARDRWACSAEQTAIREERQSTSCAWWTRSSPPRPLAGGAGWQARRMAGRAEYTRHPRRRSSRRPAPLCRCRPSAPSLVVARLVSETTTARCPWSNRQDRRGRRLEAPTWLRRVVSGRPARRGSRTRAGLLRPRRRGADSHRRERRDRPARPASRSARRRHSASIRAGPRRAGADRRQLEIRSRPPRLGATQIQKLGMAQAAGGSKM